MQGQGDNENGHISVNIEMQKMGANDQLLKKLAKLIQLGEISNHLTEIKDILKEDADGVFGADIKGKNIIHLIASEPKQNPEILSAFGIKGNASDLCEYVKSRERQEELLKMPASGLKRRCPIHVAVANGFSAFVEQMLNVCPSLVSVQDGDGNTAAHIAASSSMPEAIECMHLILNTMRKEEIQLNTRNLKGRGLLHELCTRVPKNKNARVAEKLSLILHYEDTNDGLNSVDNDGKTPLHLLCSKEEQAENADRLRNVHDLMKILIENEDGLNAQTQDELKRTSLHLLVLSEFPNLIKILIDKPETDVMIKDAHRKMAIHYATEKALSPKSQKCVKILVDWNLIEKNLAMARQDQESQDLFRGYLLWETFESENDKSKSTALTSACKSKSTITVEFILRNVFLAKRNFGTWFAGKDNDPELFSLKQVYKHTPAALEFLFDNSIHLDLKESNEIRVKFSTDISVITALARPIQEDKSSSEMKFLGYAKTWPEDIQEKLLLHPLTQCTLLALWQNMLPYKILWLIFNLIWLSAYWILVPSEYSYEEGKFPTDEIIAAWILGVLSALYILDECLAIKASIKRLISPEMNGKMIFTQVVLTIIGVYRPCLQSLDLLEQSPPSVLEKISAAFGVILSFTLFWRNIGLLYLPLGKYVEYLIQTLKKILLAFVCIAAIIVGFQRAFRQTLPHQFPPTTTWSFARTLVMMTGEFEFADMYEAYKDDEEQSQNATMNMTELDKTLISYGTWNLLVFILFLIILPVAFYNLLTGVVVDKIASMERKLEMYQTRNQIRLINYMQHTIVSKLDFLASCCKCLEHCFEFLQICFVSYRKTKNGEIVFEQKFKWFAELVDEPSFCSTVSHTLSQIFSYFRKNASTDDDERGTLSGNFLSKSLKIKLFEMHEKMLQECITSQDHDSDFEY